MYVHKENIYSSSFTFTQQSKHADSANFVKIFYFLLRKKRILAYEEIFQFNWMHRWRMGLFKLAN